MSHLLRFRKGWQSEHLARFILSKFSFISEPSNISDDLGSDFFCTLFTIFQKEYLLPQSSFAIQIKSNDDSIDISNKFQYLYNIEIPFYVGVINREDGLLTIYSGEAIPHFFALYGNVGIIHTDPKGYINLVEEITDSTYLSNEGSVYNMYFPKIMKIHSDFNYENNPGIIRKFINTNSTIQRNISSRISNEFIFNYVDQNQVAIYAGSLSSEVYRDNLGKRLCEAFYNVEWLHKNRGVDLREEFKLYETIFLKLPDLYGFIPEYLITMYKNVKQNLNW